MSSNQPELRSPLPALSATIGRLRTSAGFRITVWYSLLFLLSLATLFVFVYVKLSSSVRDGEMELISAMSKEFDASYKTNGLPGIEKLAAQKRSSEYLIRLATPANATLFSSVPDNWPKNGMEALETASSGPVPKWMNLPFKEEDTYQIKTTVLFDGYLLQLGRGSLRRRTFLAHFRDACAVLIVPMLCIGIFGGAFLATRALSPIRELNRAVREIIATGRIDARISARSTARELDELVTSFNKMLERIDGLIQAMKGALDNVAHDLRTPITRLRGIAEIALQNPSDAAITREALADCIEESERLITLLDTLMDISEVETNAMKLDLRPVNIRELVDEIVDLYKYVAEEKDIRFSTDVAPTLRFPADQTRMRQALANLVDNAVKYTPEKGRVEIGAAIEGGQVVFSIRDNGIGIPREEIPRVWERLYRGDKSRSQRGLGLGLSLVKAIVQAHRGRIEVESVIGEGSVFRLYFPA